MARLLARPCQVVVSAALIAGACYSNGPAPVFSALSLDHRGGFIVLAAVATPSSARIVCGGAVSASGFGAVRDSTPVQHRDTAVVYRANCTADANGASTTDTISFVLYGPDFRGTWHIPLGTCVFDFVIRRPGDPRGNTGTITLSSGQTIGVAPPQLLVVSGTVEAHIPMMDYPGMINMSGEYTSYESNEFRSILMNAGTAGVCGPAVVTTLSRLAPE